MSMTRYATGQTLSCSTKMISAAWVIGLVISLPMHLEQPGFSSWASSDLGNTTFHCIPPQDAAHLGYNMYAAIMAFILPGIIIIGFYVAIAIKLRTYHRKNKELKLENVDTQEKEEEKTVDCSASSLPSPKVITEYLK